MSVYPYFESLKMKAVSVKPIESELKLCTSITF